MSVPAAIGAGISTVQKTVGTTAVQLIAKDTINTARSPYGVVVQSIAANSGKVYVGGDSGLTTANGTQLAAGGSITLSVDDPSRVWLIADGSGQDVRALVIGKV